MATPVVHNKISILGQNGKPLVINNYIQSCTLRTGSGAKNVQTINLLSEPITNNMVNIDPVIDISYVLGAFDAFYAVMFDRTVQQDFIFQNYANEDINGTVFTLIAKNCRLDSTDFTIDGSEASKGVMTFVGTSFKPVLQVQA